jgi:hypothetical protein
MSTRRRYEQEYVPVARPDQGREEEAQKMKQYAAKIRYHQKAAKQSGSSRPSSYTRKGPPPGYDEQPVMTEEDKRMVRASDAAAEEAYMERIAYESGGMDAVCKKTSALFLC